MWLENACGLSDLISAISYLFHESTFDLSLASLTPPIMADKEATVYIVDVGASMGRNSSGREETNLDYAMRYVWDKITSTVNTPGEKVAKLSLTYSGSS